MRGSMFAAILLAILTLTGLHIRKRVEEQNRVRRQSQAAALVRGLLYAKIAQVPEIILEMDSFRDWADPLLRQANREAKGLDATKELHTSLALLPVDAGQVDYLYQRFLDADPNEVGVIRDALAPHKEALRAKLWDTLVHAGGSHRLRAESALEAYWPNPQVVMDTSLGTIKIELFQGRAPISVKNFLNYVDDEFYDGTIFHRVIEDIMIQGGGMTPDLREKMDRGKLVYEAYNGVPNARGTIAMASHSWPSSDYSQFFINVEDNDIKRAWAAIDGRGSVVIGRVIDGMDVVDTIRRVRTGRRGPHDNVPMETVLIKSVGRVKVTMGAKREAKGFFKPNVADILKGESQLQINVRRLEMARFFHDQRRFDDAARLFADAFAADPELADNWNHTYRYNAACCAALAAGGQAKGAEQLDEKERARWRKQALDWLRADLAGLARQLENGKAVRKRLQHWQRDRDLVSIRDVELPIEERAACRQLWADVEAVIKKAQGKSK